PAPVPDRRPDDLPDPPGEGRPRPRIGDSRPAPVRSPQVVPVPSLPPSDGGERGRRRRRRSGRGKGRTADRSGAQGGPTAKTLEPLADPRTPDRARGRERKGRPVGRYLMCVQVRKHATQIAVLEGRALIEHYISRPQDDANQIDGNIYLGRVQNVLPGMEAAFIDIGTPKNAVLYRGDLRYDQDDVEGGGRRGGDARIEQLLRPGQRIVCQVTKNPISTKGARLTGEVSLPGRFVVFIPGADTYGISKRLGDDERKRLRRILDDIRPAGHGLIVRTAAEGASADELARDVARLQHQWEDIETRAKRARPPARLYQEPDMAVRVIREEFNQNYRGVVIDDRALYEDVADYVASISPDLADRVEYFDTGAEALPMYEHHHIHEQIHRALDRKVWLASGGSLIIERTEALTVIDVNTGKNVGSSSLEETVYRNNLEAAEEVARQLRLRDIGGIIVIDFIDMEIAQNRADVMRAFRDALSRDKTRTQAFEISELGLVEMTRKRVSEGLVEAFSTICPNCTGRGIVFDSDLLS
ncbi:MAG: Rne/Rng family ribonuclease, partial [Acidimicrobiales bacterium]